MCDCVYVRLGTARRTSSMVAWSPSMMEPISQDRTPPDSYSAQATAWPGNSDLGMCGQNAAASIYTA